MTSQGSIFEVKDCVIIARMAGMDSAYNLREMRERILSCPIECIFHHCCEPQIRPTFDDPDFRNDFAVWTARVLRDRVLAERLGILNPYRFDSLEELRQRIADIMDERLSELNMIPWAPRGHDFHFMRAVTVVFDTGLRLSSVADLAAALPVMSNGTIYYHFVEARRRPPKGRDDFSAWLAQFDPPRAGLIEKLDEVNFYFLSLVEIREKLMQLVQEALDDGPVA